MGILLVEDAPRLRDTPVLVLTALDDTDEKVRGLGIGADDYLTKSFSENHNSNRTRNLPNRSTPLTNDPPGSHRKRRHLRP